MPVADLLYRLRADSKDLTKGLAKADKDFDTFSKKAGAALAIVGTALVGAAGGAAKFTLDAIDTIDGLQKMADRAGVAAEDMAGLELAALSAGKSAETVVDGFGDLAQKIFEGDKIFRRYGIAVKDARGALRPTIDVAKDLADRIQEMGPGAQATALAMKTFGGAGRELLPILLQGSEGIERFRDEADRLGLTFDENTGRAAEHFADNMKTLDLALDGMFRTLASDLLPTLSRYSQALANSSTQSDFLRGVTGGLGNSLKVLISIGEGVATVFSVAGKTIGAVGATIALTLAENFEQIATGYDVAKQALQDIAEGDFAGARSAVSQFGRDVKRSNAQLLEQTGALWEQYGADVEQTVFESGLRIEALWDDTLGSLEPPEIKPPKIPPPDPAVADAAIEELNRIIEQAQIDAEKALEKQAAAGARVFDATRTGAERYQIEVERLTGLLNVGAISQDTFNRALEQAAERYLEVGEAAQTAIDAVAQAFDDAQRTVDFSESLSADFAQIDKDLNQEARDAAARLAESFETEFINATSGLLGDAIFGDFEERTDKAVEQFSRALARMALQAATNIAFRALFGGGLGSGVPSIPGFASGGLVRGPGTATSDSIPARLSAGEYVLRARAVDHYGPRLLDRMNALGAPRARFAEGGQAGSAAGGGNVTVPVNVAVMRTEDELAEFMRSTKGQQIIVNATQRNGRRGG